MATINGTAGNDSWTVVNPGTVVIDGLGGIDTLYLGTSLRSSYTITKTNDGAVHVDSISSASGGEPFHATLYNFEKLVFANKTDTLDIATYFADTIAPTVSSFSPAAQAMNVATDSNIILTFSEAITRGSGLVTLTTADGTQIASYDAGTSSNLSISGNTLTLNPSADLGYGTTYKVVVANGSVKDLAGNAYAGISSYSFTTAVGIVRQGTAGKDTFITTSGNDIFTGGDGVDTVIYAGKKSDYGISGTNPDFVVKDNVGHDGTDTIHQVERLQFSDTSLAFDINGIAGQAYRIYQAAFDRKPDITGLGYWINAMDSGASLTSVATGFMQSAEFKAIYGANPSNTVLVTNFYHNVLHREPDQGGLNFWVNDLNLGNISPASTLASFSESPENQALVLGAIQNGIDYKLWLG
ncbi:DUF4214 domain-containing protein [Undibacterium sp. Rencai35W]|uniref:DUF4214 domain-containing protein n=1 Tax=Undibacterium sp. Rencai35W TaxID=3413046 RepID=UPI003BF1CCA9